MENLSFNYAPPSKKFWILKKSFNHSSDKKINFLEGGHKKIEYSIILNISDKNKINKINN